MKALSPKRWQQINQLLDHLFDLPPDQHTAFLEKACHDQPTLYDQLQNALEAHHEEGQRFLQKFDNERLAALLHALTHDLFDDTGEPATHKPLGGHRVGPYVLAERLGHGGMGEVFLADRADGTFEQKVALKLIRRGRDSEAVQRRFLAERRILACLRHEHIARLLDGGVTQTGQPFFVMEYVDGLRVTAYCDRHRLRIEARLELFAQVCQAVHYAHRNLVVHRDLKPSNILVTDEGAVKLLDFGIAKVLVEDQEARHQTALTGTGQAMMTPEYAAPEQVRSEAVTTATDIYALGLLLYEMLTGHRPYELESRSQAELERVICDTEPARPSTRVGQQQQRQRDDGTTEMITPDSVSQARSISPEKLRQRLTGDLDTMVLKALKKEPERRYASAEAFLEDVKRHLAGLPVSAQTDTVGYRLRKFVGRNRVGVAMIAAVAVLLAAVVGFYTVRLATERDRAQAEASKLAEVKEYLIGLFEVSDPQNVEPSDISAQELLERGVSRIEALHKEPDVQAEMLLVLGTVYRQMGFYDEAQPLLEQSLEKRKALFGATHLDVAVSAHALAILRKEQGAYDDAERLHREALATRTQRLGPQHILVAESMNSLGGVLYQKGVYDEAETLYREALALRRKNLGDLHIHVANSLNSLAILLRKTGAYDDAERLHREALATRQTLLGPAHLDIANSLNNLAFLLTVKAHYDEAEPLLREALTMRRSLLDEEHPRVANTMRNLAMLLYEKGTYDEAEALLRAVLEMRRKRLGAAHPSVAGGMQNLAVILQAKGTYPEAEALSRQALAIWRQVFGEEHLDVAIALNSIGNTLFAQKDYAAAALFYRDALVMKQKLLGPENPTLGMMKYNLAMTLRVLKTYQEAEDLLRDALTIGRKSLGETHPQRAYSLYGLGRVLLDLERPAEAEPLFQEALQIRLGKYGDADPRTAEAKRWLGLCLHTLARYDEAEPLLRESLAVFKEKHDAEMIQQTRQALFDLYTAWGNPDQAAPYLRE